MALNEPKFLQSKINKLCKKTVKYAINPTEDDSEEDDIKDEHTKKMEEGGFIMVTPN
jgi:hypothetical protein